MGNGAVRYYRVEFSAPTLPRAQIAARSTQHSPGIQLDIPDPSVPVPSGVDLQWSSVNVTFSERVRIKVDCGPFDFVYDGWNWITRETTKAVRYPSNLTVSTSNFSVKIPNVNLDLPIDSLKEPLEPLEGVFSSIQDVFDTFNEIFGSLEKLKVRAQGIPDRLQAVVSMAENVLTLLTNTVNRLGGWSIVVLMIIVPCYCD